MTEVFHNSSSGGAKALSSQFHEEFAELCALSTSGALTSEEMDRLEAHLKTCASCRELKAQYEQVAFDAMPAIAAELTEPDNNQSSNSWSLDQAEAQLMARVNSRSAPAITHTTKAQFSWQSAALGFAAALLLFLSGLGIYRIFIHSRQAYESTPVATNSIPTPSTAHEVNSPESRAEVSNREISRLRADLKHHLAEIEQMRTEKLQVEEALKQRTAELEQSTQDRSEVDQKNASAELELHELQNKLDSISKRESQEAIQLAALDGEIADMRDTLQEKNQEVAQDQDLLKYDRDIRDLVAARNLYIVDVYDSRKSGTFQKPVGRVFYTKDRSLVFYGYNLDEQAGVKNASAFQVWGTTRANDDNVSLGMFYRDDTNKSRWILKYNDAKTIAQLDRIFVTVEPEGGSKQPTGKPLLMTSLLMEPNHP